LLKQDCELDQDEVNREEMKYPEFRKSWPKINNSTSKGKIDPALVWLEIKSYIKGSLEALQLDSDERDDPMHRSDLSELVLILENSEGETARIEFAVMPSICGECSQDILKRSWKPIMQKWRKKTVQVQRFYSLYKKLNSLKFTYNLLNYLNTRHLLYNP
jgi:hypothetical protein